MLEENSHSQELVVLKPREGVNASSRTLSRYAVPLFKMLAPARWKKPNPWLEVMSVSEEKVFMATRWITGFVAVIMPVLATMAVTRMKGAEGRLLAMAAFNLLMAVCLIALTEAKRRDVFLVIVVWVIGIPYMLCRLMNLADSLQCKLSSSATGLAVWDKAFEQLHLQLIPHRSKTTHKGLMSVTYR